MKKLGEKTESCSAQFDTFTLCVIAILRKTRFLLRTNLIHIDSYCNDLNADMLLFITRLKTNLIERVF